MLIAPGRCSSLYSSDGSTSTSCAPSSRSLRTSSLAMEPGIGCPFFGQSLPEHLNCWRALEALGSRVDPAPQPPVLARGCGEQVAPVHPDRGAAGEPEAPRLL